jgi:hypothetical protein
MSDNYACFTPPTKKPLDTTGRFVVSLKSTQSPAPVFATDASRATWCKTLWVLRATKWLFI